MQPGVKSLLLLLICLGVFDATSIRAQSGRAPARPGTDARSANDAPPDARPANDAQPVVHLDAAGNFDGTVYKNSSLGFSVTVPKGWEVQDKEVERAFASGAAEQTREIAGSEQSANESIDRTRLLFIAIKSSETNFNPSVIAMSEDISLAFDIRSSHQYIARLRSAAARTPLVFEPETADETINGVSFGVVGAASVSQAGKVRQRYYVAIFKHQALLFILTFHDDAQLKTCRELLASIKSQ